MRSPERPYFNDASYDSYLEKGKQHQVVQEEISILSHEKFSRRELERGMSLRQIQLIAIGGCIGK